MFLRVTLHQGSPTTGELLAACFPHFDSLIVPFEGGREVLGEGECSGR